MIADQHQASLLQIGVDTARRVRQNQILNSQNSERANRKHHLVHLVAFVIMKTSLLNRDRNAADFAQNKLSGVTFDSRTREMRNFLIRNLNGVFDFIGKRAQARCPKRARL